MTTARSALIVHKFRMALASFNSFRLVECCAILTSAFNDSVPDEMQLFKEPLIRPEYFFMYRNILNFCNEIDSVDYQILKIALLLIDEQEPATEFGTRISLLDKSFQGLQSCYIVTEMMKLCQVTHFTANPALTVSQFYYFSSLFFGRLTHETYALRMAQKALDSLQPAKTSRPFIEKAVGVFSDSQGACAVCRNPCTGRACTGCTVLTYCSRDCQKLHWRNKHKAQCPLLNSYRRVLLAE